VWAKTPPRGHGQRSIRVAALATTHRTAPDPVARCYSHVSLRYYFDTPDITLGTGEEIDRRIPAGRGQAWWFTRIKKEHRPS